MLTLRPPRFTPARLGNRLTKLGLSLASGILLLSGLASAQTGTYGDLYDFTQSSGVYPSGAPLLDSAGNKYQALAYGGPGGSSIYAGGAIVKWTKTGAMSVLHSFNGTITYTNGSTGPDGYDPTNVSMDGSGDLFGVAQNGGLHSGGLLFEITAGGQYIDLHDFGGTITNNNNLSGPDGKFPSGTVTIDSHGNLYGVATDGGPGTQPTSLGSGMVWELTTAGVYRDLHDFGGTTLDAVGVSSQDGAEPAGGVTFDSSGNMYGTTLYGGPIEILNTYNYGDGIVWEITSAGAYKDLHDFGKTITTANGSTGSDGWSSSSAPVFDAAGDMFGTAGGGGQLGDGMLWEITAGHVYKDLHDFGASSVLFSGGSTGKDGVSPNGGIVLDGAGNLFGVTATGGPNYQLAVTTFEYTADYGGVLWELPATGTYTVLHAFGAVINNANGSSGPDGEVPNAPALDAAGNLWGSTSNGGPNGPPPPPIPSSPNAYGMMWELYYTSLSSISVSPTSVVGGASATGTVTLSAPAPSSGSVATLSSNTSYATVPLSVRVPSGQTSATFTISTFGGATVVTATISAAMAGVTSSAPLTIQPAPALTVALSPSSVAGGTASIGTVTLSTAAGPYGVIVTLSSNSANATVPTSVYVSPGAFSASFSVTTTQVTSTVTATITAKNGAATATAVLTITPMSVTGITISPTSVYGLTSATGTVTLTGPAPVGGKIVNLSSNNVCASVPSYVFVPTGATSETFTITTTSVGANTPVTVTATLNGTQTATLTVKAAVLSGITLASGGSAYGPGSTTATVTLNGPAGTNGVVVNLSSSNTSAATVPSSVFLASGTSSAVVTITTLAVASAQNVTITATEGAQTYSALLTVNPVLLTGVMVSPSSVLGGQSATGQVTVNASSSALTVNLSSSSTYATVPATVTVPANATSANFTVQTTATTSPVSVTIKASQGTATYSATLTVGPLAVSNLTLSPTSVAGGSNSTATVTLTGSAPSYGAVVNLSSNNTSATVPTSVFVAGNASTATFTVSTKSVNSAATATISATFGGVTKTAALAITASGLSSLTIAPTSVVGGAIATGTVTLNAPASLGGVAVDLYCYDEGASIPESVFVAAGATTGKFTIETDSVDENSTVIVYAVLGSTTVAANLTIDAPCVASLSLTPTTVIGTTSSAATVTLTGPVGPYGAVVYLSSNSGSATVPSYVFVAAGASSAKFTVTTLMVAASTTAKITATLNSTSASATLTIIP